MTTISSAAAPAPGTSGNTASTQGLGSLGPQDFLELLVAQLSKQNPLDPTSTSQFMAQTAALSTLEQIANLNQEVNRVLSTEQATEAMSAIGRTVSGVGPSGQNVSGTVTGVKLGSGEPSLEVAGTSLPLSSVTTIT